ncbi:hypothetical protein JMJ35_005035 [Cladonia borealis]|uniref:25S rRNA (uridine-N(3))-methyltransferase BMT5-like domain-containing protein n=1 Tax=Cladonia borealis TaxID=184061 RepID=A0AA39R1A4_9LECA|nr:hypothetical protein JMJ35_005035 [Cladonia borealis]
MGKAKKSKLKAGGQKPYQRSNEHIPKPTRPLQKSKPTKIPQPPAPTIPFSSSDRILLLGEGDFSFSRSLLETHGFTSLIATSFDKSSALHSKYPQSTSNVRALEEEEGCQVLFGVDATKLGKPGALDGGGKEVRQGNFDRVIFNFPHVGGLTKDVNRQVRYNQELLVGFFKSALPLLAPEGSIIVTIFEGEPYSLWNIRDLARHVGLTVGRSFKFQASAYPGYKHARTLGNIEGGGGWKGEDRPARTYIFEVNEKEAQATSKTKKPTDASDSDDD